MKIDLWKTWYVPHLYMHWFQGHIPRTRLQVQVNFLNHELEFEDVVTGKQESVKYYADKGTPEHRYLSDLEKKLKEVTKFGEGDVCGRVHPKLKFEQAVSLCETPDVWWAGYKDDEYELAGNKYCGFLPKGIRTEIIRVEGRDDMFYQTRIYRQIKKGQLTIFKSEIAESRAKKSTLPNLERIDKVIERIDFMMNTAERLRARARRRNAVKAAEIGAQKRRNAAREAAKDIKDML